MRHVVMISPPRETAPKSAKLLILSDVAQLEA